MRRSAVALALGGCAAPAVVGEPPTEPVVCASSRVAVGAATSLAVAPAPGGAVIAWVANDGIAAVAPDGMTTMIAPGTFDHVVAAAIGDRVVVGASAGDSTQVFGAAFGFAPYRELALIGGIAGASPIVMAGGAKLAPSVWYGGLLVWTFDDSWLAHTAALAVLTPAATELAAATFGDDAVIVWPAGGDCYVEHVTDPTTGTGWHEAGACRSPRIASVAGSVAFAFEADDGVHLAIADSIDALHPSATPLVAPGARSPRVIASGSTYWLAYIDEGGGAVAGYVDAAGVHATAVTPASALELADFAGAPQVVAIDAAGVSQSTLCAE